MIAILADIHANLPALEAVLQDMPKVSHIWVLGDMIGELPFPCAVLDKLMELSHHTPLTAIAGNRELSLLQAKQGQHPDWWTGTQMRPLAWTVDQLQPRHWDFLGGLRTTATVDGESLLCHGSPRQVRGLIHNREDASRAMAQTAHRVIACGHTHQARLFRQGPRVLVNAGSVGLSLDGIGGSACYALLDPASLQVCFRYISYDVEQMAHDVRSSELHTLAPGISRADILELETGRHHVQSLVDFCTSYVERGLSRTPCGSPQDLWREGEALWDGSEWLQGRTH